jgi:aspartate 1-decarboxylase
MQITLLKAKLHRAVVTDANIEYEGSMGIDSRYLKLLGLRPYEQIMVGNITNGNRFETYIIPAPEGSGDIVLNGAAAHLGKKGDKLVIMSWVQLTPEEADQWKPKIIVLADQNQTIQRSENL